MNDAEINAARQLIHLALAEDLGVEGDLTARATIPAEARGAARVVAREPGIVAGLDVVAILFEMMESDGHWRAIVEDGTAVDRGSVVAEVDAGMRNLLAFERTALNILQHLSGVATLTAKFVAAVSGTKAVILDTRKTLPGWRLLDKHAVRCGGGRNHRMGLHDAVLIKDNHLAWLARDPDPIGRAIASSRTTAPPGTLVEVEVDTLDQLDRALTAGPDIILVDNFGPTDLREAVLRRDAVAPSIKLEASGGVNLATVRALAETGVDFISVGALTHSAPALDLGLDFIDAPGAA